MEWAADWWAYAIIAVTVFSGCLLLNYIVNKINEVQLEERLAMLQQKSPAGRVTQVHGPLLEIEAARCPQEGTKKPIALESAKHIKVKQTNSEVENTELKPIFLGTIYSELIQAMPSKSDNEKASDEILKDVLDRAMVNVADSKSQTVAIRDETLENVKVESKSKSTVLNVEIQNKDVVNNTIAMNDLLDHAMKF